MGEIKRSSDEDVISIEVTNSEFYLKELINLVQEYYIPKLHLLMTEFQIDKFEDKLLAGSLDSTFEVMENILENAIKYGDGKRIEISFYGEDYCRIIRVFNTGTPIREEEMPHLFDSFFRGTNVGSREENGLGLYICKEIMHKMNGEIFAKREPDGMSFHLVLPNV